MRKLYSFTVVLALILLAAGCGPPVINIEGRKFSDPAEALAFLQSVNERKLGQVEPLPAPIAGHAVVTILEQSSFENMTREYFPSMDATDVALYARQIEENSMLVPRMIERRGIFQVTEILRVDNPSSATIPADGYLIAHTYILIKGQNRQRIKIGAAGDSVLQILPLKRQPTSEEEMRLLYLEGIETFVETHHPG